MCLSGLCRLSGLLWYSPAFLLCLPVLCNFLYCHNFFWALFLSSLNLWLYFTLLKALCVVCHGFIGNISALDWHLPKGKPRLQGGGLPRSLHIICEASARDAVGQHRTKSLGRAAVNTVFTVTQQPRGVRQQSYAQHQASVVGEAVAAHKADCTCSAGQRNTGLETGKWVSLAKWVLHQWVPSWFPSSVIR